MKSILEEIVQLTDKATTQPTETELPGVLIIKGKVPEHQLAAVYQPMIGLTVQGVKIVSIGGQTIRLKAPSYYIVPVEIPASGRVLQGPNGLPYISVGLRLNQNSIMDLLKDLPQEPVAENTSGDFKACRASEEFLQAWLRLLRLLHKPKDIPALAPVYEREILYRAMIGPQGWRLRQLCLAQGKKPKINQTIHWIRVNYAKPINIKSMAAKAGMGVTTFHRQFKEITGLSPLQFQKELRLLEARKILAFGGNSVAETAFKLGYESPSQFNREYARFFGAPPAKDALRLRQMENKRPIS